MQKRKKTRAFVAAMVLVCLVGAWISGELLREHAGPWPSLKAIPTSFARLCGAGPDGDSGCAAVLKSRWSAVDFNVPVLTRALTITRARVVVPVAFIGLAYYVFLGVWLTFAASPRPWGCWWYLVPFLTAMGGAVGSLAFLWIMIYKLDSRCSWCLVTHAINGLLLVGTLCLWPRKAVLAAERSIVQSQDNPALRARATFTAPAALKIMGFAFLLIMGLWLYRSAKLDIRQEVAKLLPYKQFVQKRENDPAFLLREFHANPQRVIPSHRARGQAAAADTEPTLIVFSDFQCSHCACFAGRWEKEFRRHWKEPLRVSFRHFPLWRKCNNAVARGVHPEACRASYAAEAARLQGGDQAFWQMHDLLFTQGRHLGRRPYAELAMKIGLDGERLVTDIQSESVRQAVAADIALAAKLGVRQTPTVFLNGRLVPQFCLYNPVFWEAIWGELSPGASVARRSEANRTTNEPAGTGLMVTTGNVNP